MSLTAVLLLQEAYAAYQSHFQQGPTIVLRDCLELVASGEPIPLDQVQSAGEIMERFCTGGMSLGAISRETHETIAVAMNRIKGAPLQAATCALHCSVWIRCLGCLLACLQGVQTSQHGPARIAQLCLTGPLTGQPDLDNLTGRAELTWQLCRQEQLRRGG